MVVEVLDHFSLIKAVGINWVVVLIERKQYRQLNVLRYLLVSRCHLPWPEPTMILLLMVGANIWSGEQSQSQTEKCQYQSATNYRVSPKKGSHRFEANLEALNCLKSKSGRKFSVFHLPFKLFCIEL